MASTIEFRKTSRWEIRAFVDDDDLTRLPGGWMGLDEDEARVVARMLQGWTPPPLEYGPDELKPKGETIPLGRGFSASQVEVPPRPLRLPGGSEPEMDSGDLEVFRDRPGIPITSCNCGSGVGCGAFYIEVAWSARGDAVTWTVGDQIYEFPRKRYDRAIRGLLELVGEAPRLLEDGHDVSR